jgi:putative membrane protein (TIGR04086 family)
LSIFGIAAPVFTRFFGMEVVSTALPPVIVVFAAAFAFYFGGMAAAYKAPSRPQLHGVMVGLTSFVVSPIVSFVAPAEGVDPLVNLRSAGSILLTAILVVAVLTASFIGARRGKELQAHNQGVIGRQRSRKAREQLSEEED